MTNPSICIPREDIYWQINSNSFHNILSNSSMINLEGEVIPKRQRLHWSGRMCISKSWTLRWSLGLNNNKWITMGYISRYKDDFGAGSKKLRIASLNRFGSSSWGMWPVSLRTSSLAFAPSFLHLHLPFRKPQTHATREIRSYWVRVRWALCTDLATWNAFSTGNIWSCSPHNTRTSWKDWTGGVA